MQARDPPTGLSPYLSPLAIHRVARCPGIATRTFCRTLRGSKALLHLAYKSVPKLSAKIVHYREHEVYPLCRIQTLPAGLFARCICPCRYSAPRHHNLKFLPPHGLAFLEIVFYFN